MAFFKKDKIRNFRMTKEGIKTLAIVALVVLSLGASISTGRLARENKELHEESTKLKIDHEILKNDLEKITKHNKELEEKIEYKINKDSKIGRNREEYSDTIVKAVSSKAHDSKNPRMAISDTDTMRALKSAENRVMDEYIRVTALILATMDTETDFRHITNDNPNGTKDYGIMQVNDAIIKQANEALGKDLDPIGNSADNVEVGSWEIYECYNRAKERHPEDVIWWTYAYYNRGLYFENSDYWTNPSNPDYKEARKQASVRSERFKQDYERYYNALMEETK